MGQATAPRSSAEVVSNEDRTPDWRDAAAYAPLLAADRSIIAWEWLRRHPGYRQAALAGLDAEASKDAVRPEAWGLCAFEPPHLAAPQARPLWSSEFHPAVLAAVAEKGGATGDCVDLARLGRLATIVRAADGIEHVLLSDGLRAIRMDVIGGPVAGGPVRLRYLIAGLASAEQPLLTLRRLISLQRSGDFSRSLHRAERRARRWLLMLRAHDAVAGGADQREIAAALLSRSAGEARWRSESPSLRSQIQRLVRTARRMAGGSYRALLR